MSDSFPKVAIVIPTFNRVNDLNACLESLGNVVCSSLNIIVVDNASQDLTVEMVRNKHPEILLIDLKNNLGATGASNIGFIKALEIGADYVLRLDSDTVVAPDFLQKLLSFAIDHPEGGIFSPKIYFFTPPDEIWYAGANAHHWHFGAIDTHRYEKDNPNNSAVKEVDYIWAAAMLIKRELLTTIGGFDTDFFVYHEELDFCRRAKKAGFSLWFVPDAKVWHKVGSSVHNSWTAFHWNKSKLIFYRKHAKNKFHKLCLIFYALVYMLFRAIVKDKGVGNRGPYQDALRGFIHGLKYPIKSINLLIK